METAVEAEAVNLKRFDQDLASTLHTIMETGGDPGGGNVVLLLDNAVKLSTHLCFLSSSPVLKRLYMDIEVRLEKTSYISMPGFSEKAVKQLLQFLHRGFVVFDLNESQHEFLYLCTSLKINPPVIKDFNLGDVGASQVGTESRSNVKYTTLVPHAEVVSSDDNISSETLGTEDGNLARNEEGASEDCDPENNFLENLKSPPPRVMEDVSSDDETPEHISDFLNQMMPAECNEKSDNETNQSSKSPSAVEQETEISQENLLSNQDCFESHPPCLDTFKMPDSFDIPTDYIQEILPNKTLSTCVKNDASPIKNLGNLCSDKEENHPNHNVNVNKEREGKLNLDDILTNAMLDNDNTPVQDDLMQVQLTTYRKDSSAKRNRGIQGKINPKRDRKKMMAELFNDSDSTSDSEAADKKQSDGEKKKIVDDLEEKKNRMKQKLKYSSENITKKISNSVRDDVRKILNSTSSSSSSKKKNEEDDRFIVPDNDVSISDPSSTESEEDSSSHESGEDIRSKRLGNRKKKKGGDVLAWMNRRASVKVVVQNSPKFNIMERGQYRLKLLADESKDSDSEAEPSFAGKAETKAKESDSSDDSIPRGRRIRGLKSSSDSETEARKRKKKKKIKKKLKVSREEKKESFPVPVEEVVWTPDMYRKWDNMSTKRKSGDSDSSKTKQKQIKRSHSIDLKRSSTLSTKMSDKNKFNRSISTVESSSSSSQGTPTKQKASLPWPNATTLPKIPKLKKSE